MRQSENRPASLPTFKDELIAKPKKTWSNTLSAEEEVTAGALYQRVQAIRVVGGQTSIGTEIAALFLRRRIQPLMARDHTMWMYTGQDDSTRISRSDLTAEELKDEVRRLTKLNKQDKIQLEPLREPYDAEHQPSVVRVGHAFIF